MFDPITAGIVGGGAIIGGIANWLGGKNQNETNLQIARETNAFNAEQALENRRFQAFESDTAHQREVLDLQRAGLNPILSARSSGASTPSGATASGVTARVENTGAAFGEGLTKGAGTALQVAKISKELESMDADIANKKANALAAVGTANAAQASAKATEAGMPSIVERGRSASAEADSAIAESRARKAKSEFDTTATKWDGYMNRVLQFIGGVSDAVNVRRMLEGTKSNAQRDHEFLDRQGSQGALTRPRR